jgi:hypothetical protein
MNMIVARILLPGSLGQEAMTANLVHGFVVSNLSPKPGIVDPVELVGRSKARELVFGPSVDGKVSDKSLQRVEGGAIVAEVNKAVEDRLTLLADDLADQSVDDSVTEGPAAVRVAKDVGLDKEFLFVVWRIKLDESVVLKLEADSFAALGEVVSVSHVAIDFASVEKSGEQLDDMTILSGDKNASMAASEISSKDD